MDGENGPLTGQLYGWLPLSDAAGIMMGVRSTLQFGYLSKKSVDAFSVLNNLDKKAIFGLHISKILHEKTFGRKNAPFLRFF